MKNKFSTTYQKIISSVNERRSLLEILSYSLDFELLKKEISKVIDYDIMTYDVIKDVHEIKIKQINENEFKTLQTKLIIFGWFISAIKIEHIEDGEVVWNDLLRPKEFLGDIDNIDCSIVNVYIQIEPKFDLTLNKDKIKTLHHISFDIFYDHIKTKGLIPKSKNKLSDHPQRIYLMVNSNNHDLKQMSMALLSKYKNKKFVNKINIFKIKNSFIDIGTFYKDINYEDGCYISEIIPSKFIDNYMVGEIDWDNYKIEWNML